MVPPDHRSHLLLRSDALLVSLPPGWVMQVLEGLVSSCDSRGTTNLGEEQSFHKATGKLLHLLLEHRAAFPTHQPGRPQWGPGEETRKRAISSQEGAETSYLETGSFDTSIKLVVLPSPAPEAVGHAIALEREQHRASQGSAQLHGLRGADTSPASPLLPPSSSDHRLCPQTISIPFPTSQVHHNNVIAPAPNCPGHPTQELTSS